MQSAMNGQSLPQSGMCDVFLGQHSMSGITMSDDISISDDIVASDDIAISCDIIMPACAAAIAAGICIAVAPTDSSTGANTSPAMTISATRRRMVVARITG